MLSLHYSGMHLEGMQPRTTCLRLLPLPLPPPHGMSLPCRTLCPSCWCCSWRWGSCTPCQRQHGASRGARGACSVCLVSGDVCCCACCGRLRRHMHGLAAGPQHELPSHARPDPVPTAGDSTEAPGKRATGAWMRFFAFSGLLLTTATVPALQFWAAVSAALGV